MYMYILLFQGARECRTLYCPTGQRRIKGECSHLVTKWNNFRVLLNLEITIPDLGINQLQETVELAQRMSNKTHSVRYWLDWSVISWLACHKENPRKTLITVTLERVVLSSSPKEFLKYIKQMLALPIDEMIVNKQYRLQQRLHKHIYNNETVNVNTSLCTNPASPTFNFYAPKLLKNSSEIIDESACMYCQTFPVNGSRVSSFFITELYYCDQVVFNDTEFERIGKAVYVHSINKVFYDLDYQIVTRDSRSFVHVCADKALYVPVKSPGVSVQVTVESLILLLFCEIFRQYVLG